MFYFSCIILYVPSYVRIICKDLDSDISLWNFKAPRIKGAKVYSKLSREKQQVTHRNWSSTTLALAANFWGRLILNQEHQAKVINVEWELIIFLFWYARITEFTLHCFWRISLKMNTKKEWHGIQEATSLTRPLMKANFKVTVEPLFWEKSAQIRKWNQRTPRRHSPRCRRWRRIRR